MRRTHQLAVGTACLFSLIAALPLRPPLVLGVGLSDPFAALTGHIQKQISSDKAGFAEADRCTTWFYKQSVPASPSVQGIAFEESSEMLCRSRYPGGLTQAREDFSHKQATLSLSLTFLEFAFVGDRNDDHSYSGSELADMLDSIGLSGSKPAAPDAQAADLIGRFDRLRRSVDLEALMRGLGTLYDKGYRFTPQDQAALQQVMG
jgi:hypothetical protein